MALKYYMLSDNANEIDKKLKTIDKLSDEKISMPKDMSGNVSNGTSGQVLKTKGDNTTEWIDLPIIDQTYDATSENAQSGIALAKVISNLQGQIDDLSYKPIEIKTFTISPSVVEIGSEVNEVTLNWTLNKVAKEVTLNSQLVGTSITGQQVFNNQGIKQDTSWVLSAKDEKNAIANKTVNIYFRKGIYYGLVSATDSIANDLILGLTKKLQSSTNIEQTFTVTPTNSQKVVFALPTNDYNDPVFKIGGFEYMWEKVKEFELTNSSGHKENYTVWRSVQVVADTLNITATATRKQEIGGR